MWFGRFFGGSARTMNLLATLRLHVVLSGSDEMRLRFANAKSSLRPVCKYVPPPPGGCNKTFAIAAARNQASCQNKPMITRVWLRPEIGAEDCER